ncbi:MAG: RNA-binding cell elongation regulator Jag/EloR [Oscillospiraceae bacterium]|jgi:spoIIIJ-associated protein
MMLKTLEKSGKTEEAAIAAALEELGLDRDDVSVEIVERAKSGFLGIGASPAVIRVQYEAPDEELETVAEAVAESPAAAPAEAQPAAAPAAPAAAVDEPEGYARIRAFVSGLLEHMGIQAEIEITARDNGGVNVNLSGSNMGAVIGRRGETLDAIQHLTNYAVNRGSDKHMHISVDAESYRAKREESLVRLAEKMAAKAIKYKRSMALEPMNSYERHVIHTALQDYEGVTTSSTGTEPNRRVVVSYEKPQRTSNKPVSREWS